MHDDHASKLEELRPGGAHGACCGDNIPNRIDFDFDFNFIFLLFWF